MPDYISLKRQLVRELEGDIHKSLTSFALALDTAKLYSDNRGIRLSPEQHADLLEVYQQHMLERRIKANKKE